MDRFPMHHWHRYEESPLGEFVVEDCSNLEAPLGLLVKHCNRLIIGRNLVSASNYNRVTAHSMSQRVRFEHKHLYNWSSYCRYLWRDHLTKLKFCSGPRIFLDVVLLENRYESVVVEAPKLENVPVLEDTHWGTCGSESARGNLYRLPWVYIECLAPS